MKKTLIAVALALAVPSAVWADPMPACFKYEVGQMCMKKYPCPSRGCTGYEYSMRKQCRNQNGSC